MPGLVAYGLSPAAWHVETFPLLLVVFIESEVGLAYQDTLAANRWGEPCYGKMLEAVLAGKLENWFSMTRDVKEPIFALKL